MHDEANNVQEVFAPDELEPGRLPGTQRPTRAALKKRGVDFYEGGGHSREPNFDSGIGGGGRKSKSFDPSFGQPKT